MKLKITSDDLGVSLGVNRAIEKAYLYGALNQASLMVNQEFTNHAIKCTLSRCPGLKVGLHFNLTYGKPISPPEEVGLLIKSNGSFNLSFLMLFFYSIFFSKKLEKQISRELQNQVNFFQKNGLEMSYIDSHEHIHNPSHRKNYKEKIPENEPANNKGGFFSLFFFTRKVKSDYKGIFEIFNDIFTKHKKP